MDYFQITTSPDGIYIEMKTKEQIENDINDPDVIAPSFLSEITNMDPNYWGSKTLIIKGEIVVPNPVETVVKFEV